MTAALGRTPIERKGLQAFPPELGYPVKGNTAIKYGWLCALDSTGNAVPFTAATGLLSAGLAEADIDTTASGPRGQQADGAFAINFTQGVVDLLNGTAGDALADTDAPCVCYGIDNQTVGKTDGGATRSPAGLFVGLNPENSKARVFVGPLAAFLAAARLQTAIPPTQNGTGQLAAGTLTISTATITANSRIFVARKSISTSTAIASLGATGTRTVGAPGSFIVQSLKPDHTVETNDVSTFDWFVVG